MKELQKGDYVKVTENHTDYYNQVGKIVIHNPQYAIPYKVKLQTGRRTRFKKRHLEKISKKEYAAHKI